MMSFTTPRTSRAASGRGEGQFATALGVSEGLGRSQMTQSKLPGTPSPPFDAIQTHRRQL